MFVWEWNNSVEKAGKTGMELNLRETIERKEQQFLSPFAAASAKSRGRVRSEEPCSLRTEFQRDRDRIIHSKSFRRLKHKTQVFIAPEGDHFRTRLTHTLEVAQIARTIARALNLNEDLAEAIALGHDLGHTPFGHAGEDVLDEIVQGAFNHNEQSLRVVDVLEQGKGLNLTHEVRDGILNHTGSQLPSTLEGRIVKISDRIAYINHDIDDALRGGILKPEDLPKECLRVLGSDHRNRINTMVVDVVETSLGKNLVSMSDRVWAATNSLRNFLFNEVYIGSKAKTEEQKAKRVVKELFEYYMENSQDLPENLQLQLEQGDSICRVVTDYIAGMTDRYAINLFSQLYVPRGFNY